MYLEGAGPDIRLPHSSVPAPRLYRQQTTSSQVEIPRARRHVNTSWLLIMRIRRCRPARACFGELLLDSSQAAVLELGGRGMEGVFWAGPPPSRRPGLKGLEVEAEADLDLPHVADNLRRLAELRRTQVA